MLIEKTNQLKAGVALNANDVELAVACLTDPIISPEDKADFLTALGEKGETIDEIVAFARALRARSIVPPLDESLRMNIVDVCGTGGDKLNTFNISTAAALLVSVRVPVAKHGNRAITSQAGSADVLEALGIPITLTPEEAAKALVTHRFAFFFAPQYHPAFKHIGPARKLCAAKGQRTIFNFLGPLLNPAAPRLQLVGVPNPDLCAPVAHALQQLGGRRGMSVCGTLFDAQNRSRFLDEFSIGGINFVAEFYQDHGFSSGAMDVESLPVQRGTLEDLVGGDKFANAGLIRQILRGEIRGPKRDAVLLNAGAALFLAGEATSILEGLELAGELVDSGEVRRRLSEWMPI